MAKLSAKEVKKLIIDKEIRKLLDTFKQAQPTNWEHQFNALDKFVKETDPSYWGSSRAIIKKQEIINKIKIAAKANQQILDRRQAEQEAREYDRAIARIKKAAAQGKIEVAQRKIEQVLKAGGTSDQTDKAVAEM